MDTWFYALRHYRNLMRERCVGFLPIVLTGLIASLVSLLVPWFSKFFIDEILINQNINYAIPFLLFWLLFEIIRSTGYQIRSLFSYDVTAILTVDVALVILNKINKCSKLIFKDFTPGIFVTHIFDLETNCYTLNDILIEVSEIVVYLVALPFVFLIIDARLALIVGVTVVVCVITSFVLSNRIKKYHSQSRTEAGIYSQKVIGTLENISEFRNYGIYSKVLSEIEVNNHVIKDIGLKAASINQTSKAINRGVFSIGTFFYRLMSVYLVYDGRMTIGDFFAFNTVLSLIFSPIEVLTGLVQPFQEMIVNNRRITKLMNFEEQSKGEVEIPSSCWLTLKKVSFSYGTSINAVEELSYSFGKGKLYGVVGSNGAGKSTLLQLICRYYDPNQGVIELGNIPIETIDKDKYMSSVLYIPTAGYVFPSSMRKNIIMESVYDEDKYRRLVSDFDIDSLRDKFDNECQVYFGTRNPSLSSGEKQKIVLSRSIYHEPKIYLLDEAFSYLDSRYHETILSVLRKYTGESIVIIASHDYNVIKHLDEILCIKEGRLIEVGSPPELLKRKKIFYELFKDVLN